MSAALVAATATRHSGTATTIQVLILVALLVTGVVFLVARAQAYQRATGRRAVQDALLFASSTNRKLAEADQETSGDLHHYIGLGSAVFITATFATTSLMIALAVAFSSRNAWWIVYLPFALLYGVTIFTIDRLLVSLQLNPARFQTAPHHITEPPYPPTTGGTVARTIAAATPRLMFSVMIGFIIAEPLLLTVFDDEISVRIQNIRQNNAHQAEAEVDRSYAERLAALQTPRPEAAELETTETEITSVQKEIDAAEDHAQNEDQLASAEANGNRIQLDGTTTSGLAKCADRCVQRRATAAKARRSVTQLTERKKRLEQRSAELRRQIGGTEDDRRANLQHLRDVEIPQKKVEARERAEASSGLLLRIKALEQLAADPDPFSSNETTDTNDTTAQSEVPTVSPTSSASPSPATSQPATTSTSTPSPARPSEFSTREDGFLGLTTLGWTVWIIRLWLVFIDAMPMVFKLLLALRVRRPYDAAVARDEERALANRTAEVAWARSKTTREVIRAANATRPRTSESSRLVLTRTDGRTVVLDRGDIMPIDERGNAVASSQHAKATVSYEDGRGWVVRPLQLENGALPFDLETGFPGEKEPPTGSTGISST
jgi:hypothetical protein